MKRLLIVPLLIAACGGTPAATPAAPTVAPTASPALSAPASPSPTATSAAPTEAPTTAPTQAPAASAAPTAAASPGAGNGLLIGLDPTGTFLVTPDGFALYTFDNDLETIGDSTCYGDCAVQWPPLELPMLADALGGEGVTGEIFPILRGGDGIKQVTYNNLPLYTYVGDEAPGETNGDGLGGVWHLATAESCHTMIGCE